MQISVKLHCNQSCKSQQFSIWASLSLCTCSENCVGATGEVQGEGTRGEENKENNKKKVFDKEEDMKTLRKSFDSLFSTELIFPVGLKFKNLYRDQNCSARRVFRR